VSMGGKSGICERLRLHPVPERVRMDA